MRIIRRFAPVIAAVSAALVVAGCGSQPSQVSSAAIVGKQSIPLDDVQREINWLLANVPQVRQYADNRKFGEVSSGIVRQRVFHELLLTAAQREGIKADRKKVADLIASAGGTEEAAKLIGAEPGRVNDLATDQILLEELGAKYIDTLSVDVVGAVIDGESPGATSKSRALELGRKMAADPAKAAETARSGATQVIDQWLALGEILGSDSAGLATSALFGARPGTVVVIQPNPQQGAVWLVALVKDRKIAKASGSGNAGNADPNTLRAIGLRMLAPVAEEVGIRVNPRYGVWDQAGMTVVPSERELTGFLLPARTAQP